MMSRLGDAQNSRHINDWRLEMQHVSSLELLEETIKKADVWKNEGDATIKIINKSAPNSTEATLSEHHGTAANQVILKSKCMHRISNAGAKNLPEEQTLTNNSNMNPKFKKAGVEVAFLKHKDLGSTTRFSPRPDPARRIGQENSPLSSAPIIIRSDQGFDHTSRLPPRQVSVGTLQSPPLATPLETPLAELPSAPWRP